MMHLARLLLLPLLVATASEVGSEMSSSTPSTLPASSAPVSANQTTPAMMMLMPEAKRAPEPVWSPSPQDLAPMMMHHQSAMPPASSPPQPQVVYPGVVHSAPMQQPQPQPPPQQQPFVPGNYYLSGDEYPSSPYAPNIGPSNEYRSEHYSSYPPFEPQQPNYPVQQQQASQLDTSLIPTAKHFVLVSFIGLLLLFSIIQNSITVTRRKDALVEVLSNRKKRDILALATLQRMTPEVESALKEDARIRCIQRTLCYENRKLQRDLGIFGKVLAKYLTRNVQASLRELSPGWDRLVEDAASAGLRGEDCDVLYRDCTSEVSTDDTDIIEEEEKEEE